MSGCRDLAGTQALPAGTQDPSYYNNATGAVGMRNAAVFAFGKALPSFILNTGLLTDELADVSTITKTAPVIGATSNAVLDPLDERILPALAYGATTVFGYYGSDITYDQLQGVRTALAQAMGQLAAYDTSGKDTTILKPSAGRALRGELYALYGYTEVMLSDFFCSGIPLSTLDFQHNFTYHAGSSTIQVYQDAISKFDSALALSGDSANIQNLARVGLGRTYLDLASVNPAFMQAAADDVSRVPTEYQYQLLEEWTQRTSNSLGTVATSEGSNGLPYLSGDPRTADTTVTVSTTGAGDISLGFPRLYVSALTGTKSAPITVASGVEARLIEAEAALHANSDDMRWLTILNTLRTTCANSATCPTPSPAGTGGVDSLPPLSDPGASLTGTSADSARVALLFRERAFWLYLTGHRQGDMRRQLREYGKYWRDQMQVYPTGTYLGVGVGFYGTDVTAPIPPAEYINPLFHGCLSRAP